MIKIPLNKLKINTQENHNISLFYFKNIHSSDYRAQISLLSL